MWGKKAPYCIGSLLRVSTSTSAEKRKRARGNPHGDVLTEPVSGEVLKAVNA